MTEAIDPRSVFVVHGRNAELRRSMFAFLRALGLSPIEWNRAIAMTGEGSPYIGQVLDTALNSAAAIVVLMTPDEVAYLQPQYANGEGDTEVEPALQARPNVLFEAGMALGRDSRRTVLVEIGEVRPFSDVAGRHAVRLSNSPESRQDLVSRLVTAGCAVDTSSTDWLSEGDFTAPPKPGNGLPLGRRLPSFSTPPSAVDFDLRYTSRGGNKLDKLTVINRGSSAAFEVVVNLPESGVLRHVQSDVSIEKIPAGRSVTIDVMNEGRFMGGSRLRHSFDVDIVATDEGGVEHRQEVFLDTNR